MNNKYKCTYCKNTECNVSIDSPYDINSPNCLIHEGAYAEWEEQKPPVDNLKRLMAEEILMMHTDFGISFTKGIVGKVKHYLEGLGG